jgi:Flp pilus assembly protein TadD
MKLLERGVRYHRRGELKRAEGIYRKILKSSPGHPDALHLLGCIELKRNNRERAVRLMKEAISKAPTIALYHENLAEAYLKGGQTDLAESECRLALRFDTNRHQAVNRLGLIALERGEYDDALHHFSRALRIKGNYAEAILNLSVALNRVGDHDLAAKYCGLLLRLEPRNPLAWNNLGMAHKGMGRLREAKEAFSQALELPMAKFNLGYVHLLEDNLREGLPLCESRKKLTNPGKGLRGREWNGRNSRGKRLLVTHEQGLGDTILMSRFLGSLPETFDQVTALVQEPLLRLLSYQDSRLRIVSSAEGIDYDLWCPTMSLPFCLGIRSVGDLPTEPWLRVPASAGSGGKLRIGLNWAGNPSFHYDRVRSAHLHDMAPLLEIPGVEWVSLHKGHRENEADDFGLPQPLRDAEDFYDTAVVIAGLDMVVSTETAVPNLSAALGVPTCVLAAVDYDWRWRSWYKGVTVCSQDALGDWSGAVAKAVASVQALTRSKQ